MNANSFIIDFFSRDEERNRPKEESHWWVVAVWRGSCHNISLTMMDEINPGLWLSSPSKQNNDAKTDALPNLGVGNFSGLSGN